MVVCSRWWDLHSTICQDQSKHRRKVLNHSSNCRMGQRYSRCRKKLQWSRKSLLMNSTILQTKNHRLNLRRWAHRSHRWSQLPINKALTDSRYHRMLVRYRSNPMMSNTVWKFKSVSFLMQYKPIRDRGQHVYQSTYTSGRKVSANCPSILWSARPVCRHGCVVIRIVSIAEDRSVFQDFRGRG